MPQKIFTFLIQYNGDDGYNEISFCAHSEEEAIELYENWEQENHPDKFYFITSVEIIYNDDDAKEYGDNYGYPEEDDS